MQQLSQMKITAKRKGAVLDILETFDTTHINEPGRNIPMDLFLRHFFLNHKKDYDADARTQIAELTYTMARYKGYLNAISNRKSGREPDKVSWISRMKAF